MELFYIFLLGFAVSIDGFFAGIAYGIKSIKIPSRALCTIGSVTLLCTGVACFGSHFLQQYLDTVVTSIIGSLLLITIGLIGILRQFFSQFKSTSFIQCKCPNKITFSFGKIVVSIMAKPECADMDESKHLNILEASLLGLALGLDNMVATFAAGLVEPLPFYTPFIMCFIQAALVYGGIYFAAKIKSKPMKERIAYAPGIILILIALCRLV